MINLEAVERLAELANKRHEIRMAQDAEADLAADDPRRIATAARAAEWVKQSLALGIDPGDASWATLEAVLLEELIDAGIVALTVDGAE